MAEMKRVLGYDYETFSSVDIGKCGSYKYLESPDFEILLLAYAFDDEPVKVVDLACGEPWPQEFLDGLADPNVTKAAWNCSFEREATRQALGLYQNPKQYEDTMILAAQCGLPMSLAGASEALGLGEEQGKMKEGKALIRYFSEVLLPYPASPYYVVPPSVRLQAVVTPPQANGGRGDSFSLGNLNIGQV